MAVKIRCVVKEGGTLPEYKTPGASGADAFAFLEGPVAIGPGERRLIPTGVSVEIPEGFEIQVRPRSGLALKYGVTVLNAPGTVDSDYRGEIGVVLINHGGEPFTVNHGDRIAQFVVCAVPASAFERVDSIGETDRGSGGYGSTGK
ncbi:MAG TPA: dUTP diphosphatase [Treponemataceae bacterium]|nr:dUTP diphosphatase [Treponemataceae bacterium]HPS43267.1 dUTP diphosphatase [Treponemataceae bacterium]